MRNFFIILFFISGYVYSDGPVWIKEPLKNCPSTEICVLGNGKKLEKALSVAREEMAKTLKVKIIGNTSIRTSSGQVRKDEVIEGSVTEKFNKDIEEVSDEILEGTFIKETYNEKDEIYVYLGLDKIKTGQIIKSKILVMDESIEHLFQLGRRSSLFEAIKNYPLREDLNSRYEFFTGEKVYPKVSLKELFAQKEKYFKKQTKIFFKFIDFKGEENLKKFIIQKFLNLGLVQSLDIKDKDVYTIKVFFDSKKTFLNVEGFEKYQFSISAYCYNRNYIKIGAINFTTGETGRNFNQAKDHAMVKIMQFINENIDQLNLD